jgi:hypothetical protein
MTMEYGNTVWYSHGFRIKGLGKASSWSRGRPEDEGHFWKWGPTLGIPKSKEDFFLKASIFQQYKI